MIDLKAWLLHTLGLDAYIEQQVAAALWERTRKAAPPDASSQEQEQPPSTLAQLAANNAAFRARQSAYVESIHTRYQVAAIRPPGTRPMPAQVWRDAQARRKTEERH